MIPRQVIVEMAQFVVAALGNPPVDMTTIPEVIPMTAEQIGDRVCKAGSPEQIAVCKRQAYRLGAVYVPDDNKIYYNPITLKVESNPIALSYIPHELTHWVQGPVKDLDCQALKQRELEAYRVQDKFLANSNITVNFADKFDKRYNCEEPKN